MLVLKAHHFIDHIVPASPQRPFRVVRAELRYVGNIADVVTGAAAVIIAPSDFASGRRLDHLEALQNRRVAFASPAEVIDLASPRRRHERLECPDDVNAMNLVPDLFSFVAKDGEHPSGRRRFDEKIQKAVQFDAAVVWSGEAPAPKTYGRHSEIAAIFLNHDI